MTFLVKSAEMANVCFNAVRMTASWRNFKKSSTVEEPLFPFKVVFFAFSALETLYAARSNESRLKEYVIKKNDFLMMSRFLYLLIKGIEMSGEIVFRPLVVRERSRFYSLKDALADLCDIMKFLSEAAFVGYIKDFERGYTVINHFNSEGDQIGKTVYKAVNMIKCSRSISILKKRIMLFALMRSVIGIASLMSEPIKQKTDFCLNWHGRWFEQFHKHLQAALIEKRLQEPATRELCQSLLNILEENEKKDLIDLTFIPEPLHQDDILKEHLCSINHEPMRFPVIDPTNNISHYEKATILKWLEKKPSSPMTRRPLMSSGLKIDLVVQEAINQQLKNYQYLLDLYKSSYLAREEV